MTAQPSNLAAALAHVQANLPAIVKGETATVPTKAGGKYSYSYADLADVSQVILPLLGKNGLAWITKPTFNADGKFVLAYELLHTSGESKAGEFPLPGSGTPQEIGSAITYARRYTLCAVTGVAPAADDDDGAAATHQAHQAQRERFEDARPAPDPEQVRQNILANARAAIDAAQLDALDAIGDRVKQYAGRGDIRPADCDDLAQLLDARRAHLTAEQPPMDADWPPPAKPGDPG